MTAADRLAEALRRVAEQRKPLCDKHGSDICDCLGLEVTRALADYRAEQPSEETHERVKLRIARLRSGNVWGEPGPWESEGQTVLGFVSFWLPKPPPVPEIEGSAE